MPDPTCSRAAAKIRAYFIENQVNFTESFLDGRSKDCVKCLYVQRDDNRYQSFKMAERDSLSTTCSDDLFGKVFLRLSNS